MCIASRIIAQSDTLQQAQASAQYLAQSTGKPSPSVIVFVFNDDSILTLNFKTNLMSEG